MFRNGITTLLLVFSSLSQAQDIIYKKDGSVLKGTLIEQNFETGRYRIQLSGGSIFTVQKGDIEKITKEEPSLSQTESDLNAVAAESRAKLQTSSNEQSFTAYPAAHAIQNNWPKYNPN